MRQPRTAVGRNRDSSASWMGELKSSTGVFLRRSPWGPTLRVVFDSASPLSRPPCGLSLSGAVAIIGRFRTQRILFRGSPRTFREQSRDPECGMASSHARVAR